MLYNPLSIKIPMEIGRWASLTYRTNPDHTFLEFATDVGIIAYTYGHHGTLAATELSLIEFGKAKPQK